MRKIVNITENLFFIVVMGLVFYSVYTESHPIVSILFTLLFVFVIGFFAIFVYSIKRKFDSDKEIEDFMESQKRDKLSDVEKK